MKYYTYKKNIQDDSKNKRFVPFVALVFILTLLFNTPLFSKTVSIINPSSEAESFSVLDQVKPRLFAKPNTYKLHVSSSFIPQASAQEIGFDELSAYGVIDLESGDVLFEKGLEKELPIASLTKLMTAVVALDLADSSERMEVTRFAARQIPTKIGVEVGESLTLSELLHAIMLTSANDAAQVIREGIDTKYGTHVFIDAMNEKAKFIGLENTHFDNPQGFDGNNYSTVHDYAILSHYALKNYPLIAEIVAKDSETLSENKNHGVFDLPNWNGLIGVYPNVSGVKIGYTERAGRTTAVVSERAGKKILVVSLGAPDIIKRDLYAAQLLDQGFEKTLDLPPVEVTEEQLREKYATWNE